jgi:hypothetical protein
MHVSIGEPSLPIQLASRGKASIVPVRLDLVAGDHEFHVVNLTLSVIVLTDMKEIPDGNGGLPSMYKGELYYDCTIDNNVLLHCFELIAMF